MPNSRVPRWLKRLSLLISGGCLAAAAVLLGTLLIATSCSESPTAPGGDPLVGEDPGGADIEGGGWTASAGGTRDWTVSKTVTPLGGVMLLDGLRLMSVYPNGALPTTTTITVAMRLNAPAGQATRIDFDFQPSMSFGKPVQLVLAGNYLAGTGPYVLWYLNPATGAWEKLAEQTPTGGLAVVFLLDHYSQYGVSR